MNFVETRTNHDHDWPTRFGLIAMTSQAFLESEGGIKVTSARRSTRVLWKRKVPLTAVKDYGTLVRALTLLSEIRPESATTPLESWGGN